MCSPNPSGVGSFYTPLHPGSESHVSVVFAYVCGRERIRKVTKRRKFTYQLKDKLVYTLKCMFFFRVSKSQSHHAYETAFAFIVQIRKMNSS